MKKLSLALTLILSVVCGAKAQKLSKMAPKVVVVNIGAKNPTFNEKQYPNLNFYYTPNLKPINRGSEAKVIDVLVTDKYSYEGIPEFLAKIWNKDNIGANAFMLFDKNNYCYTQGYNFGGGNCVGDKSLADNLKECVKKGKTVKPSKKDFTLIRKRLGLKDNKPDFLVGFQMPELKLSNAEQEEKSFNDIINNQPTLVVFINIPTNIDMEKAYTEKVATAQANIDAAYATKSTQVLIDLEGQLFDHDARRK